MRERGREREDRNETKIKGESDGGRGGRREEGWEWVNYGRGEGGRQTWRDKEHSARTANFTSEKTPRNPSWENPDSANLATRNAPRAYLIIETCDKNVERSIEYKPHG